jgi:hypothetical protein
MDVFGTKAVAVIATDAALAATVAGGFAATAAKFAIVNTGIAFVSAVAVGYTTYRAHKAKGVPDQLKKVSNRIDDLDNSKKLDDISAQLAPLSQLAKMDEMLGYLSVMAKNSGVIAAKPVQPININNRAFKKDDEIVEGEVLETAQAPKQSKGKAKTPAPPAPSSTDAEVTDAEQAA